jgi:hypothetical protein
MRKRDALKIEKKIISQYVTPTGDPVLSVPPPPTAIVDAGVGFMGVGEAGSSCNLK